MLFRVRAFRFRKSAVTCTVVTMLAIGGCADLNEINRFAKASQEIGKEFSGIADSAKSSCSRANSFINERNQLPPLHCEIFPQLESSLVKVNEALFNYIAGLGKLASSDLSTVPGGFNLLSADLLQADPNISVENQGKAAAASGLAAAVTNLATSGYRQHELSKIIGENDKAVQQVAQFLSEYATDKYRQSIEDEWRYEASYCLNMKTIAEPLATDLLVRKCDADKSRIDDQLRAIKDYQDALATIAATHRKLDEEQGHWDTKKLLMDLRPGITSLGNAAVSVKKAF